MVAAPRIEFDREALAALCRKHHIKRLAFFGSVLRDDVGPDSDVDLLYEFEEGHLRSSGTRTRRYHSETSSACAIYSCMPTGVWTRTSYGKWQRGGSIRSSPSCGLRSHRRLSNAGEIDRLIINSPCEKQREHRRYDRESERGGGG